MIHYYLLILKKQYFSIEQFVKTNLYNLDLSKEQIKNIFIGLKVFSDRFNKTDVEINYSNNSTFNSDFNILKNNYTDLYQIQTLPQDIYNIYLLSLRDFINKISLNTYFDENNFLNIFNNKLLFFIIDLLKYLI